MADSFLDATIMLAAWPSRSRCQAILCRSLDRESQLAEALVERMCHRSILCIHSAERLPTRR